MCWIAFYFEEIKYYCMGRSICVSLGTIGIAGDKKVRPCLVGM
jgi:hypothetical protein